MFARCRMLLDTTNQTNRNDNKKKEDFYQWTHCVVCVYLSDDMSVQVNLNQTQMFVLVIRKQQKTKIFFSFSLPTSSLLFRLQLIIFLPCLLAGLVGFLMFIYLLKYLIVSLRKSRLRTQSFDSNWNDFSFCFYL